MLKILCLSFLSEPQTTIHYQQKVVSLLYSSSYLQNVFNLISSSLILVLTFSVSDDSEEWTVDDDEVLSPARETTDPLTPM